MRDRRRQQALVHHDEGQIHGARSPGAGIPLALEPLEQRAGMVLRGAHGYGEGLEVLMDRVDRGHVRLDRSAACEGGNNARSRAPRKRAPPRPHSLPYLRSRSERSPHWSFLRMRAKKPSGPSRTSRTGCAARLTMRRSPACIVVPTWPSNETRTSSVHGGIGSTVTVACDGTTSGRTPTGWGQIPATTIASTEGTTIGPPAESAYAVEPVGVATTMPSAEYCPTSSPSTDTRNRITRATPPLWTTASFKTPGSARVCPCRSSIQGARPSRDSVT